MGKKSEHPSFPSKKCSPPSLAKPTLQPGNPSGFRTSPQENDVWGKYGVCRIKPTFWFSVFFVGGVGNLEKCRGYKYFCDYDDEVVQASNNEEIRKTLNLITWGSMESFKKQYNTEEKHD